MGKKLIDHGRFLHFPRDFDQFQPLFIRNLTGIFRCMVIFIVEEHQNEIRLFYQPGRCQPDPFVLCELQGRVNELNTIISAKLMQDIECRVLPDG